MWLRVLALCGALISLPYYYLQPEVLWQPIGWAAVFLGINGYHVWRLWLERRPVELSADEARLYELTFFPLARRRFAELARLGRWSDLEAGDVLVRPGQPVEEVVVPLTESVEARVGDRSLGRFAPGEVVGAGAVYGRPAAVRGGRRRGLPRPAGARRRDQAAREKDDQLARTLERIAREDLAGKLERLLGQAATLPPDARRRDLGAPAGAVMGGEADLLSARARPTPSLPPPQRPEQRARPPRLAARLAQRVLQERALDPGEVGAVAQDAGVHLHEHRHRVAAAPDDAAVAHRLGGHGGVEVVEELAADLAGSPGLVE